PDGVLTLLWEPIRRLTRPTRIEATGVSDGLVATFDASILLVRRVAPESGGLAFEREPWGTIQIEFSSCDLAVMSWESDFPGFGSNATVIRRTDPEDPSGCSASPPESALTPSWYQGPGTFFRLPTEGNETSGSLDKDIQAQSARPHRSCTVGQC
ncbi:MAG: hypothetical protein ACNA7J_11450, partial [Wenzhouxiangella sp.]